jgi:ribosome-binding factor A
MSHRLLQVNENLQRELSLILAEGLTDDKSLVTITHVLVTPDLREATIWTSVLNAKHPEKVIEGLNSRSSEFYESLSKRIRMKFVPRLEFKLDEHIDEVNRIDSLLDEIIDHET